MPHPGPRPQGALRDGLAQALTMRTLAQWYAFLRCGASVPAPIWLPGCLEASEETDHTPGSTGSDPAGSACEAGERRRRTGCFPGPQGQTVSTHISYQVFDPTTGNMVMFGSLG